MTPPDIDLYLVRHAESRANAAENHLIGGRSNETPLTAQGFIQAQQLGSYLLARRFQPDFAYSSPAVRTLDTAHTVFDTMQLKASIIIDDDLQELDQGNWTGRNRTETYSPSTLANIARLGKDFRPDAGESMNDVGARMMSAITRIGNAHAQSTHTAKGIIFTHGIAIRCLASTIDNWPHKQTYETVIPNVSVSLFVRRAGEWQIHYIGKDTYSPEPGNI